MLSVGIGLLVYSCPEKHLAKHRLVLNLDKSFNSWLYTDTRLESGGEYFSPDAEHPGVYDSLPEGEYHFVIHTVFGDLQTDTIEHDANDTFCVRNRFSFPVKKKLLAEELSAAQKIVVVYTVNGCFCSETERNVFCKRGDRYIRLHNTEGDWPNVYDSSYCAISPVRGILNLEDSLVQDSVGYCSTTRQSIYIKAGEKIFIHHNWDPGLNMYGLFKGI